MFCTSEVFPGVFNSIPNRDYFSPYFICWVKLVLEGLWWKKSVEGGRLPGPGVEVDAGARGWSQFDRPPRRRRARRTITSTMGMSTSTVVQPVSYS